MKCPLCGNQKNKVIYKGGFYMLHLCLNCRSNYQERKGKSSKKYKKDYFQNNHVKAYGKTYLEDEKSIRIISRRRLRILRKILPSGESNLDIGSALGIFCHEAKLQGFHSKGVEISKYARDFAKKRFNISSYSGIEKINERFNAVTLWYCLEHMEDPRSWIKKAVKLLNKNGILALAVPNAAGAYALFNKKDYFKKRPEEHYFEPSPEGIKTLLKENGFRIERIEFFGLHPERIKLPDWLMIRMIQKALRLGDTFEVYARKV